MRRATRSHPRPIDRPAFRAGGDVVEDEFVRAFVAVSQGKVLDAAHHDVIAETHALHHLAVAHVEAGDDPAAQHARASLSEKRPSSRARPRMAARAPARSRGCDVGEIADAARRLQFDIREAERQGAIQLDVEPGQHAVAGDVGAQDMAEPALGVEAEQALEGVRRALGPALDGQPPRAVFVLAGVEGQGQPIRAERLEPTEHALGLAHRHGSDDHARCAHFDHGLNVRFMAHAAARLHRESR
jgi:hypothetical protein